MALLRRLVLCFSEKNGDNATTALQQRHVYVSVYAPHVSGNFVHAGIIMQESCRTSGTNSRSSSSNSSNNNLLHPLPLAGHMSCAYSETSFPTTHHEQNPAPKYAKQLPSTAHGTRLRKTCLYHIQTNAQKKQDTTTTLDVNLTHLRP